MNSTAGAVPLPHTGPFDTPACACRPPTVLDLIRVLFQWIRSHALRARPPQQNRADAQAWCGIVSAVGLSTQADHQAGVHTRRAPRLLLADCTSLGTQIPTNRCHPGLRPGAAARTSASTLRLPARRLGVVGTGRSAAPTGNAGSTTSPTRTAVSRTVQRLRRRGTSCAATTSPRCRGGEAPLDQAATPRLQQGLLAPLGSVQHNCRNRWSRKQCCRFPAVSRPSPHDPHPAARPQAPTTPQHVTQRAYGRVSAGLTTRITAVAAAHILGRIWGVSTVLGRAWGESTA